MRPSPIFTALVLAGGGCRESPTSPYYTPSGPVPAGLTVSLRGAATYADSLPGGPSIAAAGDSVVAAAVIAVSGCSDYTARAGVADGALVVTIVDTPTPRICNLVLNPTTFRAVVRPAPSGRYEVVLRTRTVPPQHAPSERVLARGTVSVR